MSNRVYKMVTSETGGEYYGAQKQVADSQAFQRESRSSISDWEVHKRSSQARTGQTWADSQVMAQVMYYIISYRSVITMLCNE